MFEIMSQTKNIILTTTIIAILNVTALGAANEDPCTDFLTIYERGQFEFNSFRDQKIQAENPEQKSNFRVLRPCISFRCLRGKVVFQENSTCKSLLPGSSYHVMHLKTQNETKMQGDILDKFEARTGKQCKEIPYWEPEIPFGIYIKNLTKQVSKNRGEVRGLLQFQSADQTDGTSIKYNSNSRTLRIFKCDYPKVERALQTFCAKVMLSSVPFLILTILVFTMVPEANMLHNRAFRCYLGSLCIGFTTLSLINLSRNLSDNFCWYFGYTTYFAFLASYSWLCVISYNVFSNITKVQDSFTENKTFVFYSIVGWGLPFLCYVITYYAQGATWIDADLKPNIGFNGHCWFQKRGHARFIYFCSERMVLVTFDVIMFIMTLKKIRHALLPTNNETTNRKGNFEKFGMLARLSIVMGLSWVFEMVSCAFPGTTLFDYLFVFISIQGHLIFILFVLKKNTRETLKERYRKFIREM